MTEQKLAVESAPEAMSEDDAMSAAFDRIQEQDETPDVKAVEVVEADAPEPEQEVETDGEAETEGEPERVEAPSELPKSVKAVWADLTPEAREAVQASHRELSQRLREAGNLTQGLEPIKNRLVQAAKEMPGLADMKPEQVADEVFRLAQISNDFTTRPVETMIGLIRKHGLEQQIGQALQGQPVQTNNDLQSIKNELAQTKRQLEQLTNPEFQQQQFSQISQQREAETAVIEFSSRDDVDWDGVQDVMPAFVQAVQTRNAQKGIQQGIGDVLQEAYALATGQAPKVGQTATPDEDVATPDPQRAEAAKKAKSIRVSSRPTGKARIPTEDELLSGVFDRMQAS